MDSISLANKLGLDSIGSLSKRDLLLLGIGLYWGEGIKSRTGQTAIVNSDPALLKVGKKWLQTCFGIKLSEFRPYVYLSSQHRDRADVILSYWSKMLAIPLDQFHHPIIIKQKPTTKYPNHDTYFGVVALRVVKSTNLKYRIQGLISACTKD